MRIGSKSVDILSPIEGEVVAVNKAVLDSPEILCSDPYGEGWLLKVRVQDRKRNQNNLLCGGLARTWMEQKVRELRAHLLPAPDLGMAATRARGVSARCKGFAQAAEPVHWEQMVGLLLMNEGCAEEEPMVAAVGRTSSTPSR